MGRKLEHYYRSYHGQWALNSGSSYYDHHDDHMLLIARLIEDPY